MGAEPRPDTASAEVGARTASEAVAERIRARIATGALAAGDVLPSEAALLEEFGVARPTMREALRILESDGLVTVRRGAKGGARVTEPDLATLARRAGLYLQARGVRMGDLMAALRVVQPGAVALAAAAAGPAEIAGLRAQVERVATAGDTETFTDEAAEFLNTLVQAAGNETLAMVSTLLNLLVHVEVRATLADYGPAGRPGVEDAFRAWCVDQYTQLVDLVELGRADDAEAFWRDYLRAMPPSVDDTSSLAVYRAAASPPPIPEGSP